MAVSRRALLASAALLVIIAACSTDTDVPAAQNPPPTEAFDRFGQFQLRPVALGPGVIPNEVSESAAATIADNLQPTLGVLLDSWSNGNGRTLVVAPFVEKVAFDDGPDWFWAGTSAGRAVLVMRVTFTEEATGTLVADPVFFQHGFAWGTSATVSESDSASLARIANQIAEYAQANYQEAIGGPSGALPNR